MLPEGAVSKMMRFTDSSLSVAIRLGVVRRGYHVVDVSALHEVQENSAVKLGPAIRL